MMQQRILITGGTGYIGRHLIAHLISQGQKIATLCRQTPLPFTSLQLDTYPLPKHIPSVTYFMNILNEFKPNIVIHLASHFTATHTQDEIPTLIETNITFGTQLLEAMNTCNIKKIINVGTIWQNFNNQSYDPVNLYAATKEAFQNILLYYTNIEKMQAITLKLSDSYGGHDTRKKLLPTLITAIRKNQPVTLTNENFKLCLTHIHDISNAFSLSISRLSSNHVTEGNAETYYVSSHEIVALKELISMLEDISQTRLICKWETNFGRKRYMTMPVTTVPHLPQWNANISLREGLIQLLSNN